MSQGRHSQDEERPAIQTGFTIGTKGALFIMLDALCLQVITLIKRECE